MYVLVYVCVSVLNSSCCSMQLLQGVPLGVGQIYACDALGPSLLILGAVLIYSPLLGGHALLGSGLGTLAGECGGRGGCGRESERERESRVQIGRASCRERVSSPV